MNPTTPVRLLLVDDHTMLRQSLRRSLEDKGIVVVAEAGDGAEAVTLTAQHLPDVVLMDVSMPGTNGVSALKKIKKNHPGVAVVMLTMHADSDLLVKAIRGGAAGYLVKDCEMHEVVDTIVKVAAGEVAVNAELAGSMLKEARGELPPEKQIITQREAEILQHIAEGCSTAEVAERLFISSKTVKNHLVAVFQKLDASDRTQAVIRAVKMGIVHLD